VVAQAETLLYKVANTDLTKIADKSSMQMLIEVASFRAQARQRRNGRRRQRPPPTEAPVAEEDVTGPLAHEPTEDMPAWGTQRAPTSEPTQPVPSWALESREKTALWDTLQTAMVKAKVVEESWDHLKQDLVTRSTLSSNLNLKQLIELLHFIDEGSKTLDRVLQVRNKAVPNRIGRPPAAEDLRGSAREQQETLATLALRLLNHIGTQCFTVYDELIVVGTTEVRVCDERTQEYCEILARLAPAVCELAAEAGRRVHDALLNCELAFD